MKIRVFRISPTYFLFCALFLTPLACTTAFAQAGRGAISGLVSDPTGAIIPGASVTAESHATGVVQSTVTTAGGLYSFVSLNPGVYLVTASRKGFKSVAQDHVSVTVDQTSAVNITLPVGSVTEVVTVTGSSSLVDASNSTVGQLISADTINRVPLLTRNVYDLVQLSAGVTPANGSPNSSSSQAIINISSGRPGVDVSSYTINGAIIGSVYYMLDGSPLGVAEQNVAAIIPAMEIPEDGVDEFRVETQNTPASYQSGGAGVISLVSKSGGDQFHGDAFGVFRPDILAANDYFNKQSQLLSGAANQSPAFHRYQEGGSISGPILHKKLFFFADYEATQQQMFDGSNTFTVPTSAERTGDFSNMDFTIYDPTLPDIAIPCPPPGTGTCMVRQPVAGNKIANPNPIALKFLSEFPKCNYPSTSTCDTATTDGSPNLYVPGLDPTTQQKFDIRIDYYKNEQQHLFGRFSFDRLFTSGVNAFNNPWDLNYAQNVTNGRNFILGDDYTINPTTVLQMRYSFTRHYENQGGDPGQSAVDSLSTLGFVSPTAADEVYDTLPYVNFDDVGGGIGGTANYNTFVYASENSDANVTLTKLWGKHELSTGFEYMKRFLNVGQPPAPSGAYAFDVSASDQSTANGGGGSDFASFLMGMGETPGSEGNDAPNFTKDLFVAEASPYYAAFVEDTYRATKALTITAGLRWDIFGGRTERHNRLESFDPSATNTFDGVSYTGAEAYVAGGNRSPFSTNLKDLSPRLGIAWQPVANMVVRGGGGFYYGPSAEMVGSSNLDSDGYASSTFWDATCFNADGNTVFNGSSGCGAQPGAGDAEVFTGPYSFTNPFPNGVVPLIQKPTGLANNLGNSLNTMLHTQRTQLTYDFNFGIEYQLPHEVVVSAGYVGSRGLFLPIGSIDLNQLNLATIQQYNYSLCVDTSDPNCQMVTNTWAPIQPGTNANYGSATVPLWVSLQSFPQFGTGNYGAGNGVLVNGYPAGDSEYSSLQAKVQKRLSSHFTTLASFTWGKIMTDDGNPPLGFVGAHSGAPQDARNLSLEHSISPQDVKYQFTWQASYDLPIGRGRPLDLGGASDAVLGGWTVDGVFYMSSGIPIASPLVNAPISYFNQRPNLTCDAGKGAPHTAAEWFLPTCFSQPSDNQSPFTAGNAPAYLDHVRAMGANNLDMTLSKNFKLGKERNLRFEVSSFNVANKAQFAPPGVPSEYPLDGYNAPYDSSPFGLITADSNTPRQFQFGSRFTF
ncbi:MAG: carboxypeptidase regulatory-like domain-containing protein [Terracidiphilus sp.]